MGYMGPRTLLRSQASCLLRHSGFEGQDEGLTGGTLTRLSPELPNIPGHSKYIPKKKYFNNSQKTLNLK